ncbi:hypothetical protein D3C75_870960 [compost metagenome]
MINQNCGKAIGASRDPFEAVCQYIFNGVRARVSPFYVDALSRYPNWRAWPVYLPQAFADQAFDRIEDQARHRYANCCRPGCITTMIPHVRCNRGAVSTLDHACQLPVLALTGNRHGHVGVDILPIF